MRRAAAIVVVAFLLLFAVGCRGAQSYVFAVVGDLQQPDEKGYKPVTHEIVKQIAASPAKFVVIVGDSTAGRTPEVWRQFDELVKPIRDAKKEIYAVIGNNDAENAAGFVERFGDRWRVVAKPGVWMVLLDSEAQPDGYRDWDLGDAQRQWLAGKPWIIEGEAGPNPLLFFFLHRPLYRAELMKADPTGKYGQDKPDVAQLLRGFNADAVFCGHEHLYERREIESGFVQTITGGGGGKLLPLGYNHFLLVTIWPAKPKWDVEVVKVAGDPTEGGLRLPGR